eukprot:6204824-Amphidinium_carterae.1
MKRMQGSDIFRNSTPTSRQPRYQILRRRTSPPRTVKEPSHPIYQKDEAGSEVEVGRGVQGLTPLESSYLQGAWRAIDQCTGFSPGAKDFSELTGHFTGAPCADTK